MYRQIIFTYSRNINFGKTINGNGYIVKAFATGKSKNEAYHRKVLMYLCGFGAVGGSIVMLAIYKQFYNPPVNKIPIDGFKSALPTYTAQQVAEHCSIEKRIWVTYKNGVYDITDFVAQHPGGDQILIAAGSSVDPFWTLYAVHQNPHVLKILEKFRIGNLSENNSKSSSTEVFDPYENDPPRHGAIHPITMKPFNGETSPALLTQNFFTPNQLFYVRNHLPVPDVDLKTYELEVSVTGVNREPLIITLDDLKKLPRQSVCATIMCAGNRRSEMIAVKPVKGLSWGPAAVGNAKWSGVWLRDVLKVAGITEDDKIYKHVQFESFDLDTTGKPYGASIPFWRAVDRRADVLLAFEMNGEPLPRDHGFPVRVVVPGVVGARNVKWLSRIIVSNVESDSHWQQNDYKGFSPSVDWDTVNFSLSPAIQELPVISAICQPLEGAQVQLDENGCLLIQGYAWSGGGQKIVRVDVTVDAGDTWHVANLDEQDRSEPPQHWSWTLWSVRIPIESGHQKTVEIWAKAVDSCYNTQPESFKNIWNLRGVLNNAYHRIKVNIV